MGVYSKKTALVEESAIGAVTEAVDPIQFVIESYQQSHKLFEAIIETDFAQAYNESGLISLEESDITAIYEAAEKSLKDKIKEIIENFWNTISNFFKNLVAKIKSVVLSDKKIVEKYKKYMDFKKLQEEKCPVKGTVVDAAAWVEWKKKISEVYNEAGALTTNDTDKIEGIKTKMSEILEAGTKNLFIADESKAAIFTMGTAGFNFMTRDIEAGYKEPVEILNLSENAAKKTASSLKATIKEEKKAASDEASVNSLNEQYKVVSSFLTALTKFEKAISSVAKKVISVERVMYIKIGTWAAKKDGSTEPDTSTKTKEPIEKVEGEVVEKKTEESAELQEAYDYYLELVNEAYLEEALA